jgi:hypothetical protein
MLNGTLALVGTVFAAAESGVAQTKITGPSQDYPDPQCARPIVHLIKPEYSYAGNVSDSGPVVTYNSQLRQYNRQTAAYNSCMNSHIDGANGELTRIQNDANDRIKQISENANAQLKRIEGRISDAVKDANDAASQEAAFHR